MNTETIEKTMTEQEINEMIAVEGLKFAGALLIFTMKSIGAKEFLEGVAIDEATGQKYSISCKVMTNE